MSGSFAQLPGTVRAAIALLLVYGLYVLGVATVLQVQSEWTEARQYPRALIRFGGMLFIAWGLARRARWAWWLAVGLGAFWIILGLGALGVFAYYRGGEASPVDTMVFLSTIGFVLLLTALGLLLTRPSRAVFLGRAA